MAKIEENFGERMKKAREAKKAEREVSKETVSEVKRADHAKNVPDMSMILERLDRLEKENAELKE